MKKYITLRGQKVEAENTDRMQCINCVFGVSSFTEEYWCGLENHPNRPSEEECNTGYWEQVNLK